MCDPTTTRVRKGGKKKRAKTRQEKETKLKKRAGVHSGADAHKAYSDDELHAIGHRFINVMFVLFATITFYVALRWFGGAPGSPSAHLEETAPSNRAGFPREARLDDASVTYAEPSMSPEASPLVRREASLTDAARQSLTDFVDPKTHPLFSVAPLSPNTMGAAQGFAVRFKREPGESLEDALAPLRARADLAVLAPFVQSLSLDAASNAFVLTALAAPPGDAGAESLRLSRWKLGPARAAAAGSRGAPGEDDEDDEDYDDEFGHAPAAEEPKEPEEDGDDEFGFDAAAAPAPGVAAALPRRVHVACLRAPAAGSGGEVEVYEHRDGAPPVPQLRAPDAVLPLEAGAVWSLRGDSFHRARAFAPEERPTSADSKRVLLVVEEYRLRPADAARVERFELAHAAVDRGSLASWAARSRYVLYAFAFLYYGGKAVARALGPSIEEGVRAFRRAQSRVRSGGAKR
jgi:hypothetical protein